MTAEPTYQLPLDIYETDEDIIFLSAALPGIRPDGIDVSVVENQILIAIETQADVSIPENTYIRRERHFGKFARRIQLPPSVVSDQARAELIGCVLRVRLPKAAAIIE